MLGRITSTSSPTDAHRLVQPRSELGLELRLRLGVGKPAHVHPGDRHAGQHGVAQRVRHARTGRSGHHDDERGNERDRAGAAATAASGREG